MNGVFSSSSLLQNLKLTLSFLSGICLFVSSLVQLSSILTTQVLLSCPIPLLKSSLDLVEVFFIIYFVHLLNITEQTVLIDSETVV